MTSTDIGGVQTLRAGVIGAGAFGRYHAGKYANAPCVVFQGVFDPDAERAEALADTHGVAAFPSLNALIAAVDVLTVASPATTHGAAALAALDAGRHVLVEKPLAITLAEADAIAARAAERGLIVQVGHQERFVAQAMGVFDLAEPPQKIIARRCNPFSPRGSDVSVGLDLMVHDIDMARALAGGAEVLRVDGEARRERTDHTDVLTAQITFANGVEAHLTASRLNDVPDRVMRLEYSAGFVEVNFVAKTFENTTPFALNADFADAPEARDSLGANVSAFLAAVRGEPSLRITPDDGRAAVAVALQADRVWEPAE